jgi:hypothetical protein
MTERLNKKAASAASWIEHGLTESWISNRYHELDDGAGCVEFTRVASGVPHLLQHRLVQMAECVNLLARTKVDSVDLVDDLPK